MDAAEGFVSTEGAFTVEESLGAFCREPGCGMYVKFVESPDWGLLREMLDAAPWRCVIHDTEFRWHSRRPDREALHERLRRGDPQAEAQYGLTRDTPRFRGDLPGGAA